MLTMERWPDAKDSLEALQRALGILSPNPWQMPLDRTPIVGGCILCFPRGDGGHGHPGDPGWAAAVLWQAGKVLATSVTSGIGGASYEPGYLAMREGPLLEAAVRGLPFLPDVLLVNGTGRDHPRGFGIASHLGFVLDVPSVGVTHRPLFAIGSEPGQERGATSPLLLDGRQVGVMLRTRAGARALSVTPGWRMTLPTAIDVVLYATTGMRTPEPFREARRLAREFRNRVLLSRP